MSKVLYIGGGGVLFGCVRTDETKFIELDGLGGILERFGLSEDEVFNGLFLLSSLDPKGED